MFLSAGKILRRLFHSSAWKHTDRRLLHSANEIWYFTREKSCGPNVSFLLLLVLWVFKLTSQHLSLMSQNYRIPVTAAVRRWRIVSLTVRNLNARMENVIICKKKKVKEKHSVYGYDPGTFKSGIHHCCHFQMVIAVEVTSDYVGVNCQRNVFLETGAVCLLQAVYLTGEGLQKVIVQRQNKCNWRKHVFTQGICQRKVSQNRFAKLKLTNFCSLNVSWSLFFSREIVLWGSCVFLCYLPR